MSRILIVQFRLEPQSVESERSSFRRVLAGNELVFKDALSGEVEWQNPRTNLAGYDAVILAGSGELYFDGGYAEEHEGRVITSALARAAKPFAQHLLDHDILTLGICFGHQLLGYAAGVDVGHSVLESKTGTQAVTLTNEGIEDPIFAGLPRVFPAQYAHKDVLFDLPKNATILARNGDKCRFSALKYGPTMYSVQFHPERRKEDCIESVGRYPEYLPEGVKPEDIFHDTSESEKVMKNFVTLIALYA